MRTCQRKSTPEVKGCQVQKKNDWSLTPNYYSHTQRDVIIDRKRPGKGYRHLLLARDIRNFIRLLPDWEDLSQGLNAIVLSPGEWDIDGYHAPGVVHVCAWEDDFWIDYEYDTDFFRSHEPIFRRLGVPIDVQDNNVAMCQFTEATAKAYQLLRILLHELGHHHDRMTTKSRLEASHGESYAEAYALRYEALIWERYREAFGLY